MDPGPQRVGLVGGAKARTGDQCEGGRDLLAGAIWIAREEGDLTPVTRELATDLRSDTAGAQDENSPHFPNLSDGFELHVMELHVR